MNFEAKKLLTKHLNLNFTAVIFIVGNETLEVESESSLESMMSSPELIPSLSVQRREQWRRQGQKLGGKMTLQLDDVAYGKSPSRPVTARCAYSAEVVLLSY